MTDRITRDRIEDAAFDAWQAVQAADFRILMAFKHSNRDDLAEARKHVARALDRIDAALATDTADALPPDLREIHGSVV